MPPKENPKPPVEQLRQSVAEVASQPSALEPSLEQRPEKLEPAERLSQEAESSAEPEYADQPAVFSEPDPMIQGQSVQPSREQDQDSELAPVVSDELISIYKKGEELAGTDPYEAALFVGNANKKFSGQNHPSENSGGN